MKFPLIVLLALFFLAACAPSVAGSPDINATAIEAQLNLQRAAQFQTSTAQSDINTAISKQADITSTAAALVVEQVYWTATAQMVGTQTAMPITQTAMAWTPTPNATSTLVAKQSEADQIAIANKTKRDNMTNTLHALSGYAVGFILMVLAVMFAIPLAQRLSVIPIKTDERGKPQPIYNVIEGTAMDMDRVTNGVGSLRRVDFKFLPQITAARQDATTERAQMVDLYTRTKQRHEALQSLLRQNENQIAPIGKASENLFPLPDWSIIEGWDGRNGIAFGIGTRGLLTMNLEQHPHIGAIGKTGSGKSRRFLRPFLACALAAGHRVIIIGKQVDFWPFEAHPNAKLIPVRELTISEEASRYAAFLKGIVEEMNRRDSYLSQEHHSTWGQAGRENTLIVLDELGNALDLMPREYAERSYRYMRGLVKEGRKVGFNIVFASQRAKGLRDIMTQVGRAVFFVEDEQESRFAMGALGAECLQDGYFYSKFGPLTLTGAFEPSDEQLTAFLSQRQVKVLPKEDWIEGKVIDPAKLEEKPSAVLGGNGNGKMKQFTNPEEQSKESQKIDSKEAMIDVSIWREYMEQRETVRDGKQEKINLSEIERRVWGVQRGGAFYQRIKNVVAHYEEEERRFAGGSTSTAPNAPKVGDLGSVAG